MSYLPIFIKTESCHVLIVGGGRVAWNKYQLCKEAKMNVTVIAEKFCELFQNEEKQQLLERKYIDGEASNYEVVIAATNNRQVNTLISQQAKRLICRTDAVEEGNCIMPAAIHRGELVIAWTTGGASPALSKSIKRKLEKTFDEQYEDYLLFLKEVRAEHKDKKELMRAIVDERFITMDEENRWAEVKRMLTTLN